MRVQRSKYWNEPMASVDALEGAGLLFSEDYAPEPTVTFCCPVCSCPQVHMNGVVVIAASGEQKALLAEGEDEGSSVSVVDGVRADPGYTRRYSVVLRGWCENGHNLWVRFLQHKGNTFVEAGKQPVDDALSEDMSYLLEED